MTEQEITRAIAEHLGWTQVHYYEDNAGPGFWSGIPYLSEESVFRMEPAKLEQLRLYGTKLPDYCNDLNAMHEAETEKIYTDHGIEVIYETILIDITEKPLHATSQQRAEAFLRTFNKWKENEP